MTLDFEIQYESKPCSFPVRSQKPEWGGPNTTIKCEQEENFLLLLTVDHLSSSVQSTNSLMI